MRLSIAVIFMIVALRLARGQGIDTGTGKTLSATEVLKRRVDQQMADPEIAPDNYRCRDIKNENRNALLYLLRGCIIYVIYTPNDNSIVDDLSKAEIDEGLDRALKEFQKAVAADPAFSDAHRMIGDVYMGKWEIHQKVWKPEEMDVKTWAALNDKGGKTHPDYTPESESYLKAALRAYLRSYQLKANEEALIGVDWAISWADGWHTELPRSLLESSRNILEHIQEPKVKEQRRKQLKALEKYAVDNSTGTETGEKPTKKGAPPAEKK